MKTNSVFLSVYYPIFTGGQSKSKFYFFLATNYFKNIWDTFIVFEDTKMPFELKCSHELLEVKAGAYYDFGERWKY